MSLCLLCPSTPARLGTDTHIVGKKRKRSDPAEADSPLTSAESDIGESLRKRSHEPPLIADAQEEEEEKREIENVEIADHFPAAEDDAPAPVPAAKGIKGRKGKPRGRKPKEPVDEPDLPSVEDLVEPGDEPSEEAAAKMEEEEQHKTEASSMFEELAKQFASLREKIYNDRLAAMSAELEMLENPVCNHPEYLRQVSCVDARRDKQTREANAFYNYKLQSIRDRTIGERSQLHSQYFQHVREMREDALDELGKEWFNIQQERRQSNQEKDEAYIFKFPEKKSVQIRQQAKYNQEVSVLSGVARYIGFPAAPEITGTRPDDLDGDLKAMKVSYCLGEICRDYN